jgi:hypothetical protein
MEETCLPLKGVVFFFIDLVVAFKVFFPSFFVMSFFFVPVLVVALMAAFCATRLVVLWPSDNRIACFFH